MKKEAKEEMYHTLKNAHDPSHHTFPEEERIQYDELCQGRYDFLSNKHLTAGACRIKGTAMCSEPENLYKYVQSKGGSVNSPHDSRKVITLKQIKDKCIDHPNEDDDIKSKDTQLDDNSNVDDNRLNLSKTSKPSKPSKSKKHVKKSADEEAFNIMKRLNKGHTNSRSLLKLLKSASRAESKSIQANSLSYIAVKTREDRAALHYESSQNKGKLIQNIKRGVFATTHIGWLIADAVLGGLDSQLAAAFLSCVHFEEGSPAEATVRHIEDTNFLSLGQKRDPEFRCVMVRITSIPHKTHRSPLDVYSDDGALGALSITMIPLAKRQRSSIPIQMLALFGEMASFACYNTLDAWALVYKNLTVKGKRILRKKGLMGLCDSSSISECYNTCCQSNT